MARQEGRDPAAEKANSRRRLVVDRVDGLVETFIVERLSSLRSGPAVTNRLRNDVIPRWGTKSIHDIKRRDIVDLVSEVAQRGPGANRNIAKILKTFFRWCVGRAVIDFSPVEGLNLRPPDRSRDRALDDKELAAVILTGRNMRAPFGAILEVLALTGQRREEVAQMTWSEIDEATRTWHIPSQRAKNRRPIWFTCLTRSGQLSRVGRNTVDLFSQPQPAKISNHSNLPKQISISSRE